MGYLLMNPQQAHCNTGQCIPFLCCRVEIGEGALVQLSVTVLDWPGFRFTFSKPFNSLIGRRNFRIFLANVELSNFRSRAFPGIHHREGYLYRFGPLKTAGSIFKSE